MVMDITICGVRHARRIKRRGFDAVLTIEDPQALHKHRLRFYSNPAPSHLILSFEDIDADNHDFMIAQEDHIQAVISFGRRHRGGRILIHCFHGVARSAAAGFIMLTDWSGDVDAAFNWLRQINADVVPNLRMLRLADRLLKTGGAMEARMERLAGDEPWIADFRKQKANLLAEHPELYAKSA